MTTSFIIAPSPRFYTSNNCGQFNVAGYILTKNALTGAPKPTYRDGAGLVENPTTMPVSSDGSPGYPVFWKITEGEPLYRVEWYDLRGNLIGIDYNFPQTGVANGGDIVVNNEVVNFGLNEQFSFWSEGTDFQNDDLIVGSTSVADDWIFSRSNNTADIQITRHEFASGENLVPFSPPYALTYTVSTASGDAVSDLSQRYKYVQSLNNQIVTVGIYLSMANLSTTAEVELLVNQNFGTGGSVSILTPLTTFTVTDSFQFFEYTFTVPSIAGNTIGPNEDDYLEILFRMNPSQLQSIYFANYQFQSGSGTSTAYPYIISDEQYAKILPYNLKGYSNQQGTNLIGWSAYQNLKDFLITVPFRNYLIGWFFYSNPNQLGKVINTTSVYPNNDGGYICDMTILQSDGNNVVTKNSFLGQNLILEVVTGSKKFGIGQIIENSNSGPLFSKRVSCYFVSTSTSITATIKFAIIGWSGTENEQKRQFVDPGAWNATGTNPTLTAGWTYLFVSEYTSAENAFGIIESFQMPDFGTYSSFGVFWWIDDTTLVAGNSIEFVYANLTVTNKANQFIQAETIQETLEKCQRYFFKTYDTYNENFIFSNTFASPSFSVPLFIETTSPPVTSVAIPTPYSYNSAFNEESTINSQSFYGSFQLPVPLYAQPNITFYNPVSVAPGTLNGILNYSATGSVSVVVDTMASTAVTLVINSRESIGFSIPTSQVILKTTSGAEVITINLPMLASFNIVADSQLGV